MRCCRLPVYAASSETDVPATPGHRVAVRVPRAKTRLHVNPLSPALLATPAAPDWEGLLTDTSRPLHLDLGCAYGEFILALADLDEGFNYVGVDLRERVLDRGRALIARRSQRNVALLSLNIRHPLFLDRLLNGYGGPLTTVSVLFPDPWKKPAEKRRRLLQPELVDAVACVMPSGGRFVTATDNADLAAEMRAPFEADTQRWRNASLAGGFAPGSPFPVATAWESTIGGRASPTYWTHYLRT
jgi:tRNA (guanine-N7-)-methyltransferase